MHHCVFFITFYHGQFSLLFPDDRSVGRFRTHTPLSLIRGPILLDYRCPLLCGDFRAVSSAMVGQPVDIRDDICPEQNKKA